MKRSAFGVAGLLAFLSIALFSASPALAAGLSIVPLSKSSVTAGQTAIGTAKLDSKAPAEGVVVSLLSGNTSVVTVPSKVTVKSGKQTATFTVKSNGTVDSQTVTITASADGVEKTARLTVNPAKPSSLILDKSVTGGNSLTGTITLSGVAPTGGLAVQLASTDPVATVAETVTVGSAKTSATFKVSTQIVTEATPATISAVAGTVTKSVTLTVNRAELSKIAFNVSSVTGGSNNTLTATVTLTGAAPAGGLEIAIEVGDEDVLTAPESVVFAANAKTAVVQVAHFPLEDATDATISAELFGKTKSDSLTVSVAAVTSITVSPGSAVGGATAKGKVSLDAPAPEGGFKVTLKSSSSAATVPAFVIVPEGARSVTFDIETIDVTANKTVKISAGSKFFGLVVKA